MSQPKNIPQKESINQPQNHEPITEPQQHETTTAAQQHETTTAAQQHEATTAAPKVPTCYNCDHKGHKVPDCPVPRAPGRRLPFDPRRKVQKASRKMTIIKFNGGSHSHHTHYH